MAFQLLFAAATLALTASAQSTTTSASNSGSTPTISILAGSNANANAMGLDQGFVASVIAVQDCDTTLALQCTALACSQYAPNNAILTLTQNPNLFQVVYGTALDGVSAQISESCSIESSSTARCVGALTASVEGQSTATTTTVTETGLVYAGVPVTAGAEKLGASCTASGSGAAPTTGVRVVYKVLVPVGAAAVGAMAML